MFGIGLPEIMVILVVALLVFGPSKLPELARSLGRGLAEFRRASSDIRQGIFEDPQENVSQSSAETDTTTKGSTEVPSPDNSDNGGEDTTSGG